MQTEGPTVSNFYCPKVIYLYSRAALQVRPTLVFYSFQHIISVAKKKKRKIKEKLMIVHVDMEVTIHGKKLILNDCPRNLQKKKNVL